MFEKVIEFSAHEDYFALKEDYPIPVKLNIPDWYKKLDHFVHLKTVKGCMPFLDTLTSGYLLKMPQDFYVKHNVDNKDDKGNIIKDSFQTWGLFDQGQILYSKNVNLNSGIDTHPITQLEGSPLVEKNKTLESLLKVKEEKLLSAETLYNQGFAQKNIHTFQYHYFLPFHSDKLN
jgi:hypothetical protein